MRSWGRIPPSAGRMVGRLLLVALAVGGCGGSGSSQQAADAGPSSTDPAISTTASTGAALTTASTVKKQPRVEYPSGGPSGPVFPPGTKAYAAIASGSCAPLLRQIQQTWGAPTGPDTTANQVPLSQFFVYRAAAEACLQQWDAAIADFNRLKALPAGSTFTSSQCPETIDGECDRCNQLVFAWVSDLVQRRKADPSFTPTFVKSTAANPCPPSATTTTSTSGSPSTTSG